MPTPNGVRLALLETRLSGELSELVRRFGGTPYPAPAAGEDTRPEQVPAFLDKLSAGRFSVVICLTGVGCSDCGGRLSRSAF
jgi:uroporphyrinogen-III synthase